MNVFKRLFAAALLMAAASIVLLSCEEDPELANNCTGCPAGSPYSKPGEACFATQNDCEQALGAGCVVCI